MQVISYTGFIIVFVLSVFVCALFGPYISTIFFWGCMLFSWLSRVMDKVSDVK